MSVNVSNAAGRTHDRTGGQVYFPASQDIAGHGSGGRTSRPANCGWAALRVATGPGPLLGKNGGGATATHGVLFPRVIPSAAPGFEETRTEEDTSELQSPFKLVCRLLLGKKKKKKTTA